MRSAERPDAPSSNHHLNHHRECGIMNRLPRATPAESGTGQTVSRGIKQLLRDQKRMDRVLMMLSVERQGSTQTAATDVYRRLCDLNRDQLIGVIEHAVALMILDESPTEF
jgi:hypothetical protein